MKKNQIVVACMIALTCAACSTVSPDAGHQVVLIRKPMFFGSGGVDTTPIQPGLKYVAFTTQSIDVNMQPQRVDLEFADMMTASGVPVNFHVVLTFQITDSVKMVRDFGADVDEKGIWGFFNRNLDQPIRTAVRDEVKKHQMQEMAITASAVEQVTAAVRTVTDQIVIKTGVPIKVTDLNVGRVNPPDSIKNQRIETAAQEQRVITEQQRKLAEDQRKMAEEARASADNAYNEKMRLSPEQYVQLEQIAALREICGKGTCTFITGASMPLVNIK